MCFLAGVCLQKIKLEEGRNFAVLCRFPGSSGIPNKQTEFLNATIALWKRPQRRGYVFVF